jgi:beta-phosphoglucomutase-like phosphatase (HAD superfamily)/dTDP-glucose pyrophosphorylase
MPIKLLIFDLDGVLLDCKDIHKKAFIKSWNDNYKWLNISDQFHDTYLDGRNTYGKIEYLEKYFNIKVNNKNIFEKKQINTLYELELFNYPTKFYEIFNILKNDGYLLACASNSIRKTVELVLNKLKIINLFDCILSNEDVENPKPSPDIYIKTMNRLNIIPEETLIFEDSDIGLLAARNSKANVIQVIDSVDLNIKFLYKSIKAMTNTEPWKDDPNWKLMIIIPMAGEGSRFKVEGYTITKPLIPIQNKPMIQWVLDNIKSSNEELQKRIEYHLCVRSDVIDQLKNISNIYLHSIPALTEGPACTVLSIRSLLENNKYPILIANSDQYLEWDFDEFINAALNPLYQGCISTFYQPDSNDLKWSYAELDENGCVVKVAEKEYISSNATTGLYFWKSASNFVKYSDEMIRKNDRVKNEFYIGPVYNYAINNGDKLRIFNCKKMWGLGVPTDLKRFISEYLK